MCLICMSANAPGLFNEFTPISSPNTDTALPGPVDTAENGAGNVLAITGKELDVRWNISAEVGTPQVITFNFPETEPDYLQGRDTAEWTAFSADQQAAARQAMEVWDDASGLTFVEVPAGETAEITFQFISMSAGVSGYAYFPFLGTFGSLDYFVDGNVGGDIFINKDRLGDPGDLDPGNRGFTTLLHEIGHTIGLKHPFENSDFQGRAQPTLPDNLDNGSQTLMSYNNARGLSELGVLDLEAAELLYGEDREDPAAYWDAGRGVLVQETASGGGALFGQTVETEHVGNWGRDTFYTPFGGDTVYGGGGDQDTVILAQNYIDPRVTVANDGSVRINHTDGGVVTVYGVETFVFVNGTYTIADFAGGVTLAASNSGQALAGGRGLDVLTGGNGADMLEGNGGDDTVSGGRGADTIEGGSGDDSLSGNNAADFITGGQGQDEIFGGTRADTLYGDDGDDRIVGQRHGDELHGGDGEDNLKGGGGNDTIYGNIGDDFIKGGTRVDELHGGFGNDRIFANSFDDFLAGGRGNDFLNGGGGDDTLDGGQGNDTMKGGGGSDTFVFRAGDGNDRLIGFDGAEDVLQIEAARLGGKSLGDFLADQRGAFEAAQVLTFDDGGTLSFGDDVRFGDLEGAIQLI
ncbi:MAG: matrixin family metalloprotease [Pseudomonadota bacterium]